MEALTGTIEIAGVTYTYPGRDLPAIKNINLKICAGELVLIAGATGSGKSTLALCLNGLIPHVLGGEFKGKVVVDGLDTRHSSVAELATRLGLLFQDTEAQICNLYGYDEIAFGCENLGLPINEIRERISWASKALGLDSLLETPVQHLSLGLKQRIALASILAMRPRILVLDEPTSNLDPFTAESLAKTIDDLRRNFGITVLIIEHDADTFVNLADHVLVLDKGEIVLQGSTKKVFLDNADILLSLGIQIPQLCGLLNGLKQRRIHRPYASHITIEAVSQYILTECKPLNTALADGNIADAARMPPAPVLTTSDVSLQYTENQPILRDINVHIFTGETVGVLGANGAGKTSLGKVMAGLRTPTRGSVELNGVNLASLKPGERTKLIGFVFQEPDHQFIKHCVGEDIAFSWRSITLDVNDAILRANEILERLGLSDRREAYVYQLSMGQRRKLSIATMLIPGKLFLILDEPMTGLDARSADQILAMLRELRCDGLTTTIITQDMRIVGELCDRIIVLRDGGVAYEGSPLDLFQQPQLLASLSLVPPVALQVCERLRDTWGTDITPVLTVSTLLEQLGVR